MSDRTETKLSVIIPAYNAEPYIERCMKSILGQTVTDYEVVVVDDGSTDGTADIVREMVTAHPGTMIRLVQQENSGSSQARRAGAEEARGEWVTFVDADDWVEPVYFEQLLSRATEPMIDLVCGEYQQEGAGERQTNTDPTLNGKTVLSGDEALLALFNRTAVYPGPCFKLFRKEHLLRVRFPEGHMVGEDFLMVLGAVREARQVALSPADGYHYVSRWGSQAFRPFDEAKLRGVRAYHELYENYEGSAEERKALARFITLFDMSCLLQFYRWKQRESETEKQLIDFIRAHKKDYIRNSFDPPKAKLFARLIGPRTSALLHRLWPRRKAE